MEEKQFEDLRSDLVELIKDKGNHLDERLACIPFCVLKKANTILNSIHILKKASINWKRYLLKDFRAGPEFDKLKGVYVIFFLDWKKPLYVGQSSDIRKRLNHHNFLKKFKDDAYMVAIRTEKIKHERFTLEAKLMQRLKPSLNKRWG